LSFKNKYDIVISGAGPSGSQCAEVLARAGFSVALIERDKDWRKPCGGGVSSKVIALYPQLKKLNIPKIKGYVIYSASGSELKFTRDNPENSTVMDRLELDSIMRDSAVDAGADLYNKYFSYDFLYHDHKKVGIKTRSSTGVQDFQAKIIVIADGVSSKLAPKSGLRSKWSIDDLLIAKCSIMEGDHNLNENRIYIYFKPYSGYGWIFPLGGNRFNIGAGGYATEMAKLNLNQVYKEFIQNPNLKSILPTNSYKTIWTGAYPEPNMGVLEKSLCDENIMLVGDNAGFVNPINGEGIFAGVMSGKAAAETAIFSLENESLLETSIRKYKKHPEIKQIIRSFKLRRSLIDTFLGNQGMTLNRMFKLSEEDEEFKTQLINLFLGKAGNLPTTEVLKELTSKK